MRKVNKDFHAPPSALQQGFAEKKENLLERKSEHQFDGRIYNTAVKQELKKLYHNKCAYCECMMGDADFTVEHYRPKKGSYSYYWLGYEWSNLLPVCTKCNNAKGDKFPVRVPERVMPKSGKKSRVKEPQFLANGNLRLEAMKADHRYLIDEKPYLLHPELDEPQDFLSVQHTGQLIPSSKKDVNEEKFERAYQTIKLTNLNRDDLIYERRKIIEAFESVFKKQTFILLQIITDQHISKNNLDPYLRLAYFAHFETIENQFKDDREYTLTALWTWENIKEMIFKKIHNNKHIEKMLNDALNLYLQTKP
jgi:5-methylcytosine-specific restriction endonuclease McrA